MKASDFKTVDQHLDSIVDYLCNNGMPDRSITGNVTRYKMGLRALGIKYLALTEVLFGDFAGCWKVEGTIAGTEFEYYI